MMDLPTYGHHATETGYFTNGNGDGNGHAGKTAEVRSIIINLEVLFFLLVVLHGNSARNASHTQRGSDRKHSQVEHVTAVSIDLNINVNLPAEESLHDDQLVEIHHPGRCEYSIRKKKKESQLANALSNEFSLDAPFTREEGRR